MSNKKKSGWGLGDIPISLLLLIFGAGYWWFIHLGNFNKLWSQALAMLPSNLLPTQIRNRSQISYRF